MKMKNFGAAYKTSIKNRMFALLMFCGIVMAVMLLIFFGLAEMTVGGEPGSFTGLGFSGFVMLFVIGIVNIRESMRLNIQNGTGRTTTFFTELLSNLTLAASLSLFSEIVMIIFGSLTERKNVIIADIYEMIFEDMSVIGMPFIEHLKSFAVMTVLFFAMSVCGMFCSLVFYRLSKVWKVVVGVAVPITLGMVLPIFLSLLARRYDLSFLYKPFEFAISSPLNFAVFFAAIAVIAGGFSWLLIKRAPIVNGAEK